MAHSELSLAEQGQPQTVSIEDDGEAVYLDSATTNVILITGQSGSNNFTLGKIKTLKAAGRKLRFHVRADQTGFTARFDEANNELQLIGSFAELGPGDTIEFLCLPADGGTDPTLVWTQINALNLT